mgnify:CR=1 FL=1
MAATPYPAWKTRAALAATRAWQRALAVAERLDPPQLQRRLARIRAALAAHLRQRDPRAAHAFAQQALAWMRAAGGYSAEVERLAELSLNSR